jgi:ankyrin repeat protein
MTHDNAKYTGETGQTYPDAIRDIWRPYRIAAVILTAITGMLLAMLTYFLLYQLVFFIHTFVNYFGIMSGSTPPMSKYLGDEIYLIGMSGLVICGLFSFEFASDPLKSRRLVMMLAFAGLPFGIGFFTFWVLDKTKPGSQHIPPKGRVVLLTIAVIAVGALAAVSWDRQIHFQNEQIDRAQRATNLFQLIYDGTTEEVQVLLEQGADPNQKTPLGTPALTFALELELDCCKGDYYNMIVLLLDHGADPNVPSRLEKGANYVALVEASKDEDGLLRWLDYKEFLHGHFEYTPLDQAILASEYNDNIKVVELLVKNGADINMRSPRLATITPLLDELGQLAFRYSRHLDGLPSPPTSPLELAVNENYPDAVLVMLGLGVSAPKDILARVRSLTNGGNRVADHYRDHELLQALLELGVDPNTPNSQTSLASAVMLADVDLAKLLLEYGADPDQVVLLEGKEYTPRTILADVGEGVRQEHRKAWEDMNALLAIH